MCDSICCESIATLKLTTLLRWSEPNPQHLQAIPVKVKMSFDDKYLEGMEYFLCIYIPHSTVCSTLSSSTMLFRFLTELSVLDYQKESLCSYPGESLTSVHT